jgi:hypothetical protein
MARPWPDHDWPWDDRFQGEALAVKALPPRRIAAMTEVECARFETVLPNAAEPAFGAVDPISGEVLTEDAEFWDFDIFK